MPVKKTNGDGGRPWWLFLLVAAFIGCSTPGPSGPPAQWTSLNAGMTREEITSLLGPASRHLGPTRDLWHSKGWELQVDYDQNGRARNIVRVGPAR